jgi:FkbM family methyltransferase
LNVHFFFLFITPGMIFYPRCSIQNYNPPLKQLGSHVLNAVAEHSGCFEPHLREAYAACFPQFRSFKNEQQHILALGKLLTPDSSTIDVGCHRAKFLSRILKQCPNGKHFAFEPLRDLHTDLVARFHSAKNLTLVCAAVASEPGEAHFFRATDALACSSLRNLDNRQQGDRLKVVKVRVTTLDESIPPAQGISYIKIDVEGGELGVFQGAQRLLETARPSVCFEHNPAAAKAFGVSSADIFDFLDSVRYDIYTLGAWLAQKSPVGRQEFVDLAHSETEADYLAIPRPTLSF